MQFDGNPNSSDVHISASSNTGAGWSTLTMLQGPRANAADPMLSSNNYVAGLNPQTVYCVSNSFNPGVGTAYGDSGLLVWMNNGSGWSLQAQPESHTGTAYFDNNNNYIDDRWLIDKPSIAVSQHANTNGTVYAAYMRVPVNGNGSAESIGFAMFDDVTPPASEWKIRTDVPTPVGSKNLQSPVVVINQTSSNSLSDVYVIYLDDATNRIYVYRTSDKGASWVSEGYFDLLNTSVRLATVPNARICVDRTTGDCVGAESIVSARFNWHNPSDTSYGSIGIILSAWDGVDPSTAKMRSYFFRWLPVTGFDRGPIALTDASLDSWNPAIDYNSTGNYVVSWYRRVDNSTLNFRTEFAYMLNDGTFDHTISCGTCSTSDVTRYTAVTSGGSAYAYFIGEYQDLWYTSYLGYAAAATVDISGTYGDIATYGVVP
jgi:hypothetical protein